MSKSIEPPAPVVRLDAYPRVYLGPDGATLDPTGHEIVEPREATVRALLAVKYPGVAFNLPGDPSFREADPVPFNAGA